MDMTLLTAVILLLAPPPEHPVGFPAHPGAPGLRANALYARGKYEEALALYREGERKDVGSWCGTCNQQRAQEYRYAQAVCLDRLGRYDEAVAAYIKSGTGHVRLADLYQAAGQLDDFKSLADQMDAAVLKANQSLERSPSRPFRHLLAIRDLEKAEKWAELIDLLKVSTDPREADSRSADWPATEASRILARHPAEATPPLLAAYRDRKTGGRSWLAYSLARCGTPEAIAELRSELRPEMNIHVALNLVYALGQGGEDGKAALRTFAQKPGSNLRLALDRWSDGTLDDLRREVEFPAPPKGVKLPVRLPW